MPKERFFHFKSVSDEYVASNRKMMTKFKQIVGRWMEFKMFISGLIPTRPYTYLTTATQTTI